MASTSNIWSCRWVESNHSTIPVNTFAINNYNISLVGFSMQLQVLTRTLRLSFLVLQIALTRNHLVLISSHLYFYTITPLFYTIYRLIVFFSNNYKFILILPLSQAATSSFAFVIVFYLPLQYDLRLPRTTQLMTFENDKLQCVVTKK